ncbi:hypothetical protein Mal33_11840 [Rosistilla oblonga]|uniref:Uncharacterized protein n=1 Tax=Rosistilla oblonga TaxID=2527990 RepID=A0A518IQ47_9BACT|nr:hypothetical protein Mal33_11840 [Rosistilla oblonga]
MAATFTTVRYKEYWFTHKSELQVCQHQNDKHGHADLEFRSVLLALSR